MLWTNSRVVIRGKSSSVQGNHCRRLSEALLLKRVWDFFTIAFEIVNQLAMGFALVAQKLAAVCQKYGRSASTNFQLFHAC